MKLSTQQLKTYSIGLCLVPLLGIVFDILTNNLGANAMQALHIRLGDWALRFLCITLLISPLQSMTKWRGMADFRQLFGLFSFFYAFLHVLAYLLLDFQGQWSLIYIDILESSYLWFGLITFVILLLLAISSPNAAKKRLGVKWKKLHRFIYLAAATAVLHFLWQLKGNMAEPLFYMLIIGLLLLFRVVNYYKNRKFSKLMLPIGRKKVIDE
ncbi:protein-methionine-sulfoxide reductase heme-binding subunit MsrQ [Methylomonas sp. AM2-LC]|uniref:sulfite oxidase heme-binding subunit YedZ n=1 Tax=Methylomonas sp. AM2-LC TaxID=3153301 RepID=UPI0032642F0D